MVTPANAAVGSTMRRLLTAVLAISLLGVSTAAAQTWFLHDEGIGASAGATQEDDGMAVHAPGNALDGRVNRVVRSGATPGDGGIFLDALLGNTAQRIVDVYAWRLFAGVVPENTLLPGHMHFAAWYGSWMDLDGNGVIDDIHDAECEPEPACADDEFRWRGHASGEGHVGVAAFVVPYTAGVVASYAGGGDVRRELHQKVVLEDRTARSEPAQQWSGAMLTRNTDGGFLATIHTVVVAGARPASNTFGYDLDDDEGLVDVDRYAALSDDVESLWAAALDASKAPPTSSDLREIVEDTAAEVLGTEIPEPHDLQTAITSQSRSLIRPFYMSAYAKEPNHAEDDFGLRATFGGVGDVAGSFNEYPGYEDAYGFYMDAIAHVESCPRAVAVNDPLTGARIAHHAPCPYASDAHGLDPLGAPQGARSASLLMTFSVAPYVWRDTNGDTHLGEVCDPEDPDAFDAERNTCRDTRIPYPYPHAAGTSERVVVCEAATAKAGTFVLTPLGGPWPDVVVIRDHGEVRPTSASAFEMRGDASPITLRWRDACSGSASNPVLHSRDAVFFPRGSDVVIRMEAYAELAHFLDAQQDIDVADQHVRDVDVLVATLS